MHLLNGPYHGYGMLLCPKGSEAHRLGLANNINLPHHCDGHCCRVAALEEDSDNSEGTASPSGYHLITRRSRQCRCCASQGLCSGKAGL